MLATKVIKYNCSQEQLRLSATAVVDVLLQASIKHAVAFLFDYNTRFTIQ